MLLRVIGKRNKERVLPLAEPTRAMLREVWKIHRSKQWLFPNRKSTAHLSRKTARSAFNAAGAACGFGVPACPRKRGHGRSSRQGCGSYGVRVPMPSVSRFGRLAYSMHVSGDSTCSARTKTPRLPCRLRTAAVGAIGVASKLGGLNISE